MFALKKYLPRSLLGRSLLILVIPLILLQVVATIIFFDRHWQTVSRRLSEGLAGDIAVIIETLEGTPEGARPSWMARTESLLRIQIRFEPGARLDDKPAGRPGVLIDEALSTALDGMISHPYRIDSTSSDDDVEIRVQMDNGVLSAITPRKRLFTSTTYIFLLWMVGASLVLFAVATIFMRNQIKPIRRLAEAANNFGMGRDAPHFKPEGAEEVRRAAHAFLMMRSRIQRQIDTRTRMLSGVSHDLGTVLTRMKLELALLSKNPETEALARDVDEMQHMIEGYLDFARGEGLEPPRSVDLDGLLQDLGNNFRRNGGRLDISAETGLRPLLRPAEFRRAIGNLLDNARRYATQARLEARALSDEIVITVDDDGPGIPVEQREDVFKPFYRVDSSRNPETGGVGLGLSIARDIIHRHGGTIELGDSPMGGLRVIVHLPL